VSEGRECLFEHFLSENLTFTEPCPTLAELEGLNDSYDGFICGSDQIWSPLNFDPHYFLDFAGDDRLKVAYAPSVGLPGVDDPDVARHMARLCGRFDALSTREESGSRIVAGLTGRKVETVVDPTLLLDDDAWFEMAHGSGVRVGSGYLLAYMLGRDEGQWERVYALSTRLALPVRVIPVFKADLDREGCIDEPIGPVEFVSLIANASYVCTDSFHGIAFSANLGIDFCAFERFKATDKASQNSRVYNILDMLGLRGRLATDDVTDAVLAESIDWEKPKRLLARERERSLVWLKAALELEPKTCGHKNNIERDRSLCCGCTACEVACPVDAIMVSLDDGGFWRARVDESACVSCGKCRKVCPFIEHASSLPLGEGQLYSYKCFDSDQLLNSSSGGAGAVIAADAAGVGDAVLGCSFERGAGAVGRLVRPGDDKGLAFLAGSKYMQSEVGGALADAYVNEGPLLVTGTPCQIAAARNLLGGRDDITYVDLICHGVPTRFLYERYSEWLHDRFGIDPESAETVFRYKPRGWRERYIYTSDGSHEACMHQRKDPYYLMFEAGQCYAGCCYECPWRATSAADVRLGDYWGPKFADDRTGVSMLLVLTERGKEIVRRLEVSGVIAEQPLDDYTAWQQTVNNQEPIFRDVVLAELANKAIGIETICDEYAEPVAVRHDFNNRIAHVRHFVNKLLGRK
jgi:coenzyme F420-reducing hydrogenase beta subunit